MALRHHIVKKLCVSLIGVVFALLSRSSSMAQQTDIHSFVRLDTIINTRIPKDVTMPIRFAGASTNREFWMYIPTRDRPDSILFLRYEYARRTLDTCWGIFSRDTSDRFSSVGVSMAVNDRHCAILFYDRVALFDIRRDKNGRIYLSNNLSFPIESQYKYIGIQGNVLILGRSYNFHPQDAPTPTEISLYNIGQRKTTRRITPDFKYVEFSHFAPNHWIDASAHDILFSQTSDYHMDIYNTSLHKREELSRTPPGWKAIDSTRMMEIHALPIFQQHIIKPLIDSLSPIESVVSRIESAQFAGDSTILVRYIPANSERLGRERRYDIWRFSNGMWRLKATDLRDSRPALQDTCSRDNYPFLAVYNPTYCSTDHIVKVMSDVEIQRFGKTYKAIEAERDDTIAESEPTYHMLIYTFTLSE